MSALIKKIDTTRLQEAIHLVFVLRELALRFHIELLRRRENYRMSAADETGFFNLFVEFIEQHWRRTPLA